MFPRDLLAPLYDRDFRLVLLAALRYAMGRSTYMSMVVADYIKHHLQLLDDKFLALAAYDIRRHFEDYEEYTPNSKSLAGVFGLFAQQVPYKFF